MATVDSEQKAFIGDKEHLAVLLKSIEQDTSRVWNDWRMDNHVMPDLRGVNLEGADLGNYDFSATSFDDSNLSDADLTSCDLNGANFYRANLTRAKILHATAHCIQCCETNLTDSNLTGSVFNNGNFKKAILTGAKIHGISRTNWDIEGVECDYVFTKPLGDGRFPREDFFKPRQFEEIYKYYPLIDLEFHEKFDALTIVLVNFAAIQLNDEDNSFNFQVKEVTTYGEIPTIKVSVKSREQIGAGTEVLKQRIAELQEQLAARQLDVDRLYGLLSESLNRPPQIQNSFNGQVSIGQFAAGNNLGQHNNIEKQITVHQYTELVAELESSDLPEAEKTIGRRLIDEVKDAATNEARENIREWTKTLASKGLEQLPRLIDFIQNSI